MKQILDNTKIVFVLIEHKYISIVEQTFFLSKIVLIHFERLKLNLNEICSWLLIWSKWAAKSHQRFIIRITSTVKSFWIIICNGVFLFLSNISIFSPQLTSKRAVIQHG